MIIFGCSVLDINDVNGWWGSVTSPGKKWVDRVSGPQTWLGFQAKAPLVGVPGQDGETALYALASERVAGRSWIEAWRRATGNETSITPHKFVGAVAIEECNYYYWKEYCYPIIGCRHYTWEVIPCSDWNSSSQGLEGFMASPAEVHIYDHQGRHVGPNEQGGIDTEIPGSAYRTPIVAGEPDADARRVSIRTADLSHNYRLRLVGTDEGTFDFFLEIPDRSTGTLYQTTYVSVPVGSGAEFALTLARGTDFVLAADADGDGVFEGQVMPSEIFTRTIDLPVNLTLTGTAGENGWYVSDVTATVSASTRPDLPPIVGLEYDLGGGWQPYQTPLLITQEGTHTLHYRGAFADGSRDVTQWVNIRVDKTPPVVTITQPSAITYTLCSTFSVEYEADDAISGLEAVTATFDGEVITKGQTIDTLFLVPGPHEIVVTARDRSGWVTTERRTIEVEATIAGLICAKHRLYDMGWIYGPGVGGIVNSLDAKLEAAQRAYERGQRHTAVNILNAFVHEVEAQTGKHITAEAAAILIRGAQYVTNRLTRQVAVSPGFGGRLSSADERVNVGFAPGAVAELAVASYRPVTETLPLPQSPVGPVFDLSAAWYGSGAPVESFLRLVTITVKYSEDDLAGVSELRLALHYWDGNRWVEVPTAVEESQNQAVAEVRHFTIYALLERRHTVYLPLVIR